MANQMLSAPKHHPVASMFVFCKNIWGLCCADGSGRTAFYSRNQIIWLDFSLILATKCAASTCQLWSRARQSTHCMVANHSRSSVEHLLRNWYASRLIVRSNFRCKFKYLNGPRNPSQLSIIWNGSFPLSSRWADVMPPHTKWRIWRFRWINVINAIWNNVNAELLEYARLIKNLKFLPRDLEMQLRQTQSISSNMTPIVVNYTNRQVYCNLKCEHYFTCNILHFMTCIETDRKQCVLMNHRSLTIKTTVSTTSVNGISGLSTTDVYQNYMNISNGEFWFAQHLSININ